MGAVDIKKALWNEDAGIFLFEAEVTKGDDTRYFFYVPENYQKELPAELQQVASCLFLLKTGITCEKVLRLNLRFMCR